MDDKTGTTETHTAAAVSRRVAEAWDLRVRGVGWDEVARRVGYSNGPNALRAVRRYAGTLPSPSRESLRAMLRARTELLWSQVQEDVAARRPGAVRAAVAVLQRAAQLDGLDEPQRVAVSADDVELDMIVDRLMRASGRVVRESAAVLALPVLDAEIVDDEKDPQTD